MQGILKRFHLFPIIQYSFHYLPRKKKKLSKDKNNRKFRTEKSVLIVVSMLNDKSHLFAGHKHGCYYLMAGKEIKGGHYVVYVPFPTIKKNCSSHKNPINKLPYFSATVQNSVS